MDDSRAKKLVAIPANKTFPIVGGTTVTAGDAAKTLGLQLTSYQMDGNDIFQVNKGGLIESCFINGACGSNMDQARTALNGLDPKMAKVMLSKGMLSEKTLNAAQLKAIRG